MQKKGCVPDAFSYSLLMGCLCERGRVDEAQALLNEMCQKGISPNSSLFNTLIGGLCKAGNVDEAWKLLERAQTVCTMDVPAYSMLFNELCNCGRLFDAQNVLDIILQKGFNLDGLSYVSLIRNLCKEEKLEEVKALLNKLVDKGCIFDPASYIPLIDTLDKLGKKHEVNKLADDMMKMAARHDEVKGGFVLQPHEDFGFSENYWRSLLKRDEGSTIATKILKRILKGWGQSSVHGPLARKHGN